jgi:dipeptidyl-peptidase-4
MFRSGASLPVAVLLTAAALGKTPVTLDAVLVQPPAPIRAIWAPDRDTFVWREGDKLRLFEVASKGSRELLDLATWEQRAKPVPESEAFPWVNRGVVEQPIQWSQDGRELLLSLKGDVFLFSFASGQVRQLTQTPFAEHDPKLSPDGRWVSFRIAHDLYLLDIRSGKLSQLTRDGSPTRLNGELDWVYPEELGIPTAYWWSPDSRNLAYLQFDVSGVMQYPHGDLLKVNPVYEPQRFPRAGTPNPRVRLGVIAAAGGKTRWLDLGADEHLIGRVTWLPDASGVAVHRLNRVQNRLSLIIASAGRPLRTVLEESDPAWINLKDDFRFLRKSQRLVWGSERSGFRHVYVYDLTGGPPRGLTSGDWEVTELACVDETADRVYYLSTEVHARERQLFSVALDGSGRRRLSTEKGTHGVSMAESCRHYLATHSSIGLPPRHSVHTSTDGAMVTELRERDRKAGEQFEILPTEFIEFKAKDGALFLARLIKPAGFDPSRKYPAVVQVYGGPHAQTVRDLWRGTDWDQFLAHRGFVVWQMDNRGSASRGHAWETPLHKRFGRQELADQLEGVAYLISLGFIDRTRIGIQGWSYGGFLTLYSLLNAPDVFRAGISGAPVTDWRNYDTIYTERYLSLPQHNEEGYRDGSPVHQASKLRAKLLLVHNFEDDNVLFQHTLRMMDALQQAGKKFEFLLYPQKAHVVSGSYRKHMLESMAEFLEKNLKP